MDAGERTRKDGHVRTDTDERTGKKEATGSGKIKGRADGGNERPYKDKSQPDPVEARLLFIIRLFDS